MKHGILAAVGVTAALALLAGCGGGDGDAKALTGKTSATPSGDTVATTDASPSAQPSAAPTTGSTAPVSPLAGHLLQAADVAPSAKVQQLSGAVLAKAVAGAFGASDATAQATSNKPACTALIKAKSPAPKVAASQTAGEAATVGPNALVTEVLVPKAVIAAELTKDRQESAACQGASVQVPVNGKLAAGRSTFRTTSGGDPVAMIQVMIAGKPPLYEVETDLVAGPYGLNLVALTSAPLRPQQFDVLVTRARSRAGS